MTRTDFQTLITAIRASQDKLLSEKGADYTQKSDDVHKNFKVVAEETGQTPLQVWAVYAAKHWLAIMSYVKHGAVASEPIESRFRDLGNYLLLGEGLLLHNKKETSAILRTCAVCASGGRICSAHCTRPPNHLGPHVECNRVSDKHVIREWYR